VMAVLLGGMVLSEVDVKDLSSAVLSSLGKDKTLTGRTDLWKVAFDQIDDQPLTGDGFGAFWRPGNPKAEVLWAEFGITNKMGFHFHDTYLQTSVDLGIFGCAILIIVAVQALLIGIKNTITYEGPMDVSVISILVFFLSWSLVEVEFIGPFSLSAVVLCVSRSFRPSLVTRR
jgi:exopolysaccharide production protein ExoQ